MAVLPSIVIDTNVWISSFLWSSKTLDAVLTIAKTKFQIIGSHETLAEIAATFSKPKFTSKMSFKERQLLFDIVVRNTLIVEICETVSDCRDPRDNKFLELAVSGGANQIITGDGDLLALHPWRGVSILTPRQFVEANALP
ncbi:MAG: putative toxin-antitoxin system toxin component, PIN family [Rhodospirillales bacterium]|nr:putative toxin-antitoxin system toxin component, PIN family [Rhodospirillales bacterium]